MLTCPFCGAPETDRLDLDGRRFLVFRCMFSPSVDPTLSDDDLDRHLKDVYATAGDQYFRGVCDVVHLYVAKGEGAERLKAPKRPSDGPKVAKPDLPPMKNGQGPP